MQIQFNKNSPNKKLKQQPFRVLTTWIPLLNIIIPNDKLLVLILISLAQRRKISLAITDADIKLFALLSQ